MLKRHIVQCKGEQRATAEVTDMIEARYSTDGIICLEDEPNHRCKGLLKKMNGEVMQCSAVKQECDRSFYSKRQVT